MADTFSITINIPVKDHTYKYLKVKYGDKPVVADRRSAIGSVVLSILNHNGDVRHHTTNKGKKVFSAIIKEEHYLRNGIFIDERTAQVFNNIIENLFKEELYCHVIINKFSNKIQYLDCIRNFLKIYDINEEDIKLESLYRDFKRKRDAIKERMKLRISA